MPWTHFLRAGWQQSQPCFDKEFLLLICEEVEFHRRRLQRLEFLVDDVREEKPFCLDVDLPRVESSNCALRFFVKIFTREIWPCEISEVSYFVQRTLSDIVYDVGSLFQVVPPVHSCQPPRWV